MYPSDEEIQGLDTKATPVAADYMVIGDSADPVKTAKKTLFSSFVSAVANYITNTVGGFVNSVTGLDTDNTDPQNPIVRIATDGVTILGDGTPGNPLSALGGGGSGGSGNDGGKPMTFAIPSVGAGSLNPSIGYQDREAYAFGAGNVNFYLEDATGYIQVRDISSDWAAATTTEGHALIGNDLYLLLLDTSGLEARIYKYDASDLSLGGAQMTISGASLGYDSGMAMTSNGTKLFISFDAGNSASANEIAGFTVSGTTATYVSTVTCGGVDTPFLTTFAVTNAGEYYGINSGVITQYDNTGTLVYTSGASGATGQFINWDNTIYIGESGSGICVKLFLPGTDLSGGNTITTYITTPAFSTSAYDNVQLAVNTTMLVGLVTIPIEITVNDVSLRVDTVNTAGDMAFVLYSEDGQTKYIDDTATFAVSGLVTKTITPVTLSPGNYYACFHPIGTADLVIAKWEADNSAGDILNGPGNVFAGTITITANTTPSTINPTTITPGSSFPAMRFDS